MPGRDLISKRTRNEFRETLVGWTLREIDTEFENEDFAPDLTYQPPLSGQRRSLVEQYYRNIDFSDYRQVERLLRVYETVIRTVDHITRSTLPPSAVPLSVTASALKMAGCFFPIVRPAITTLRTS